MTTGAKTGKGGSVTIGSAVAEVTAWNISHTVDAVEATSMDSSGKGEYIPGIERWSGSFNTLKVLNKTGSQAAATFDTLAGTAAVTSPRYSGAIIITDEPVAVPVDGRIEFAYTFQGTGTCTVATA